MTDETLVRRAALLAALLGALPAPTSMAITAVQLHMVRTLEARRRTAARSGRPSPSPWIGAPLVLRTAGTSAWLGVVRLLGASTPVGMIAGAAIAGAATYALGRAAAADTKAADSVV
jgi:uncharacterized protein (DUF697 family)